MKHLKLFFALFAMLALGVGNAWGDVTCDFTTKSASHNVYTDSWKYGDFTVFGGANNSEGWAYVKMGGKQTNLETANPVYISSPEMTSAISKVQVSIIAGSLPKSGMSVNSWGVYVYSDANMTNQVDYVEGGTITKNAAVFEFTPTFGTTWSANNYYKVSFNLTNTTTTNGIIWVDKVTFVESTDDGGDTPEPTPSQLTAPANLKEVSITETSATLSWDAVANASNYSVTINGNTETVTTNSYSATGLTAGTEYTWSVVAKGDGTNYTDSEAAQHTFTTKTASTPGAGSEGTLVITRTSFPSGALAYKTTDNWSAIASTGETVSGQGDLYSTASQTTMQTKNTSVSTHYHNTTAMPGAIKKISMEMASGTNRSYTVYASTSQISSTTRLTSIGTVESGTPIEIDSAKGYKYFWLQCTGGASYLNNITITYETSGGDEPSTPTPSVTLNPSEKDFGTVNVGETPSQEFTITTENTTATLTASIDNTTDYAVSAIDGDKVTVTYQPQSAGTHPAVLTVKAGEEATATVNLTGKAVQALEGTWILVTDASSLKAGDEIIIAAKEYDVALSTTQNNNNRGEVAITKNQNTITATTEAQVLTLQAGTEEGTLALYTGAGYLHAASSSANHLKTETELSDNSSWTIAVEADGTATLTAQGTYERNTLCYNKSNKLFACYASTNLQQPIVIYKNTNGQQLAGLAYTTTKYLTKLGDAFATPALTNPNSLTVTYSSSDNNVATVAADGAVTIKAAGVVVITAAFAGDASYLEGSAKYTLCVTEHAGTQADPYSVADARRVIDVMETAEGVYATGIVSEIVTAYNSNYGNISYNISADGLTTSDQLQAYRGKSYDGANFTSADDVKVGDEVVIKGTLKKYSTTYEFDENNQLVSLNRTKEQAGLAYAETELTANVSEDFAEPTLTNPNSLSITYSSSNTTLATVNATTGEVTILAAGKVTITASTAGDATYAAGSASYNITITDPSLAVATLPFAFNGNKATIETTAGMTQNGLGSDYSASTAPNSQLKFGDTGVWVVIRFDSEPEKLSYDIKNNSFSGGTFSAQESADGETYTDVAVHTEITETQSEEHTLLSTSRYVKFIYTEKVNGNVGLGNIKITKPDNRADAGLAWNPTSVTLTQSEAFTAPTLQYPNDITGSITYKSNNDEVATVTAEGEIALASAIGTATITATFAGDDTYKPATATCTITVNEYIETIDGEWELVTDASKLQAGMEIIIASVEVDGKYYTMSKASDNGNNRTAVESTISGDKLNPAVGTSVLTLVDAGNGTFALQAGKDKYLYAASSSANQLKEKNKIDAHGQWTITIADNKATIKAEGSSNRNWMQFNPNNGSPLFSCYAYDKPQKDIALYAKVPEHSRTTSVGRYGTICLPGNIVKCLGATLYEVAGKDGLRVVFDEVLTPEEGMPYIFLAHNAEVLFYCGDKTAATPGDHKSLHGTFSVLQDEQLKGMYMVQNNKIVKCADTGCGVAEYRAYFDGYELDALGKPGAQMPGRKRITMGTESENTVTGTEDVVAPAGQTLKIIENGQLIIIRNGEKFNAQGQKL